MEEIKGKVKKFILDEFLPGESPEALNDETPLITGGVLDSIGTLKLVSFLEETFNIQIKAHKADFSNLNTISDIAGLVHTKLETG